MYETQHQYQLFNDPQPEPRRSKWGWILLGMALGLIVGITSGGES